VDDHGAEPADEHRQRRSRLTAPSETDHPGRPDQTIGGVPPPAKPASSSARKPRPAGWTSPAIWFVIHRLCGESFYFLLVRTRRRCNELWETVYGRDGNGGGVITGG